jgi:hypothetical protein
VRARIVMTQIDAFSLAGLTHDIACSIAAVQSSDACRDESRRIGAVREAQRTITRSCGRKSIARALPRVRSSGRKSLACALSLGRLFHMKRAKCPLHDRLAGRVDFRHFGLSFWQRPSAKVTSGLCSTCWWEEGRGPGERARERTPSAGCAQTGSCLAHPVDCRGRETRPTSRR